MNRIVLRSLAIAAATAAAALIAGCASGVQNPSGVPVTRLNADEQGFVAGTGVESQDLVAVTDKMARSILAIPEIQKAQGLPRVVLLPVENQTRFAFNKDIFLDRIRVQLNSKAQGKVRFLARDRMEALEKEREMKRAGQLTSSSDPVVQEFYLGIAPDGTSDYILYPFQLIDPRTSDIIWEDSAEIKKQGTEDAAYR